MKILNLVQRFFPSVGGAEKTVLNISQKLSNKGHFVMVYSSNNVNNKFIIDSPMADHLFNFKIKRFPIILKLGSYMVERGLLKEICRNNFQIVHTHCYGFFHSDVAALARRIKKNFRLVLTAHGFYAGASVYGKKLRTIYDTTLGKFMLKSCDALIALNSEEEKLYRNFDVNPEKVHRVSNGVDEFFFTKPDVHTIENFYSKYNLDRDMKIVLSVGRIEKLKGFHFIIRALSNLDDLKKKIQLIIIGSDWGYKRSLVSLSKKFNFKNIRFIETHSKTDLRTAYHISDVFSLLSLREGFSLSLVEAMAAGKPVIASDIPANREILENTQQQFIFNPFELNELTDGFRRLLTDEKLSRTIGSLNRTFVKKNYSWDKVVDKLEQIYYSIL
ncbi:MAG: glycosyltransferase family 4 protein [Candidatus Odinarchaeia archaeon]